MLSLTATATVPAGSYGGLVKTRDYSPLEPAAQEAKYYARGIGVVLTEDLTPSRTRDELVRVSP